MLLKNTFHRNRASKTPVIFVSGWATNSTLVAHIDAIDIVVCPQNPHTFVHDLHQYIQKQSIQSCHLIGFSLGAYLAKSFSFFHPTFIQKLTLIGIRPSYPHDVIDTIATHLKRYKESYLRQFYTACFYDKKEAQHFIKQVPNSASLFNLDALLETLLFLKQVSFSKNDFLSLPNLTLIQGKQDLIAPNDEISEITNHQHRVLKNCGHIPFFNEGFMKWLTTLKKA